MSKKNTTSNVRFIKPPNKLKMKVGTGGIEPQKLEKAQNHIDTVELDFIPYAKDYLKQLNKSVKEVQGSNDNYKDTKDIIIAPVMQLKANGGMFQYQLLSDVADIALQFLEAIEDFNDDAQAVLKAHENTIKVIIANNLKGDGGNEGYALVKELDRVCKRYFTKHPKKTEKKGKKKPKKKA